MKKFFWKDKTGGGRTETFTLTEMKSAFKGERNWDGQVASTWAQNAEVGDEWENAENLVTRIE